MEFSELELIRELEGIERGWARKLRDLQFAVRTISQDYVRMVMLEFATRLSTDKTLHFNRDSLMITRGRDNTAAIYITGGLWIYNYALCALPSKSSSYTEGMDKFLEPLSKLVETVLYLRGEYDVEFEPWATCGTRPIGLTNVKEF